MQVHADAMHVHTGCIANSFFLSVFLCVFLFYPRIGVLVEM
jgi:hypothetical protein